MIAADHSERLFIIIPVDHEKILSVDEALTLFWKTEIFFVRILCLGIALSTFVLQLEPKRDFRLATISFDSVGYADYRALYLTQGEISYPVLFADEKVYRYLFSHMNGGTVKVLLRPDNGIVEMRSGERLIFSVD